MVLSSHKLSVYSLTLLQREAVGRGPESDICCPGGTWIGWCKETWDTQVGQVAIGPSLEGPHESPRSTSQGLAFLRRGAPHPSLFRDGDWWTVLSDISGREYSVPSIHVARISHG